MRLRARWEGPRMAGHGQASRGAATRRAPAAGHLTAAFRKWDGSEGAAAQLNAQPRKPSFTHPWATGRPVPSRDPRGVGHGPCRDTPATGWHRAGQPARGGRSQGAPLRVPAAKGDGQALPRPAQGATATCGRSHAAPLPAGGSGARRGRPQARPPPPGRPGSTATAPAPPAGILTR